MSATMYSLIEQYRKYPKYSSGTPFFFYLNLYSILKIKYCQTYS